MTINADSMTGQTTIALRNLQNGYTLNESVLPESISVSGYTGMDSDVLTFTAPLSYAGESLVVDSVLQGQDVRSALNLFWYDNSNPNQQRMVITAMDETVTAVSAGLNFSFEEAPKTGFVKVTKTDAETAESLAGVTFGVYADGEKICELVTADNGTATSPNLPIGDYYLKEINAPTGYLLSSDKINVNVMAGKIAEVTVTNKAEPTATPTPTEKPGKLLIIKKADGTSELLKDAVLGVYRTSDDEKMDKITTDRYGEAKTELPVGEYYLRELKAPYGYLLESTKIYFTVTKDAKVTVEITNQRDESIPDVEVPLGSIEIPKTDEDFPIMNCALGISLLAIAFMCVIWMLYRGRKIKIR